MRKAAEAMRTYLPSYKMMLECLRIKWIEDTVNVS